MRWADHIHPARFESRIVILDVIADRYRLLGPRQSAVIGDLEAGTKIADREALNSMVDRHWLVDDGGPLAPPLLVDTPNRSIHGARYGPTPAISAGATTLAVIEAAFRARRMPFHKLLAWARGRPGCSTSDAGNVEESVAVAMSYDRHRSRLPLERICLRDGLALHRLLARRNLPGTLVFGVRLDPFGAHCWVQAGDVLLSDHLDSVRQMRPILAL